MTEILRPGIEVAAVRDRFSSLHDFAFLDAPGGSQVPDEVGEAIARALREASANLGAGYATSRRVGEILAGAGWEKKLLMTEILRPDIDVAAVRDRFSSLHDFAFLDAPGGSQVPDLSLIHI